MVRSSKARDLSYCFVHDSSVLLPADDDLYPLFWLFSYSFYPRVPSLWEIGHCRVVTDIVFLGKLHKYTDLFILLNFSPHCFAQTVFADSFRFEGHEASRKTQYVLFRLVHQSQARSLFQFLHSTSLFVEKRASARAIKVKKTRLDWLVVVGFLESRRSDEHFDSDLKKDRFQKFKKTWRSKISDTCFLRIVRKGKKGSLKQ